MQKNKSKHILSNFLFTVKELFFFLLICALSFLSISLPAVDIKEETLKNSKAVESDTDDIDFENMTDEELENLDNSRLRGSLPFILDENNNKVFLDAKIDSNELQQNQLLKEQLLKLKDYYFKLKNNAKNPEDFVGALYIKDLLTQMVVYTPLNMQEYIRLNIHKQWAIEGTPFMSLSSYGDFNDDTLVFGHNMFNLSGFGGLRTFNTKESFNQAPPLIVYDEKEDCFKIYKLFTEVSILDGKEFLKINEFEHDKEGRRNYLRKMKDRSRTPLDYDFTKLYNEDGTPILDNDVIWLQRCQDTGSKAGWRWAQGFLNLEDIDAKTLEEDTRKVD